MKRDPCDIFEILVRQHSTMLRVFLGSLIGNPSEVDDLCQECMIIAWRKLDQFDRTRPFGPWLRGIAYREALNFYRRSARSGALVGNETVLRRIDEQIRHIESGQRESFEDAIEELRSCMDALPPKLSEAVSMRYLREHEPQRAACHMQISREALKKRLQRGLDQLLKCLRSKAVIVGDVQ